MQTGAAEITGVQVDSRRIVDGDLFVAVGEGARFRDDAFARGAAATLVPDDAFAAMAALGRAVRSRSSARVVAITGSYGKTTTKDILASIADPATADRRRGAELQQRDRRPADAVPARAGDGDLHHRAGHARLRTDRRAGRADPARDRGRRHHRARASREGRLAGGSRPRQERADRGAAARRHRDRPGRLPGRAGGSRRRADRRGRPRRVVRSAASAHDARRGRGQLRRAPPGRERAVRAGRRARARPGAARAASTSSSPAGATRSRSSPAAAS